jgi:methylmalonyl-CoA epimerase
VYRKIDHIGVAVASLNGALSVYETAFGLLKQHVEEVAEQGVRVAMLPIGESRIELLEPMSPDSPVGKFLAKRGEGIHHICFQVDNLEKELSKLKQAGVRLIDEAPRKGAGGCLVAFVHPSATGGVLIELSQPA